MTDDARRSARRTEPMEPFNARVPRGFRERLRKLRGHLMAAGSDAVAPGLVLDELVRARLELLEVIADGKAGR